MSRRILLADDSVTIQKVIELTFMDEDYEVRTVGNGDEALAMLTALQVDFVIADVHMPGASGYEVCRRSKQQRPKVPVLLLVGTFEPFDELQARECGADSYLKKPFDSQELLERVHQLLGPAAETPAAAPEAHAAPVSVGTFDAALAAPDTAAAGVGPAAAMPAPGVSEGAAGGGDQAGDAHGAGLRPVEAAESWQEFELEAEPELIPEPWHAPGAPQPPPPAAAGPAAESFEHSFALGDLDDHDVSGGHEAKAGFEPAAARTTPATPSAPPAASDHQPFTLGEPLDDHSFLIEEDTAPPVASPSPGAVLPESEDQRSTRAEPVSPFGGAWAPAEGAGHADAAGHAERAGAADDVLRAEPAGPSTAAAAETAFAFAASAISIYSPASSPDAFAAGAGEAPSAPSAPSDTTAGAAEELVAAGATEEPIAAAGEPIAGAGAAEAPLTAAAGAGHPEGNGQPAAAPALAGGPLAKEDVDRIARRVVELIGDQVVRDIAWEVIPDLAEVVIKDRLRELESQIE